jgi:hypothetical protein
METLLVKRKAVTERGPMISLYGTGGPPIDRRSALDLAPISDQV